MENVNSHLPAPRIVGLDSLRIVLALTVTFSHGFGLHFQHLMDKSVMLSSSMGTAIWLIAGNLYNGQAAVIVFFVISGFCIHYPYIAGRRFNTTSFLSKRYIRIGIPLALCLTIGYYMFNIEAAAYMGIWSLVCEIIYYTAYPLLRKLRAQFASWIPLYVAIIIIAGITIFVTNKPVVSDPGRLQDFPAYGLLITSLIGLPIWMLGCQLAETNWNNIYLHMSRYKIWISRSAILLLSIICSVLKFHGYRILGHNIPNYISLHIFAIPVFFWLRDEIVWYFNNPANMVLEWGGKWSYSLYIIHPLVIYSVRFYGLELYFDGIYYVAGVAIKLAIVISCAYIYYFVVERPSHLLARMAAS